MTAMTAQPGINDPGYDPWAATGDDPPGFDSDSCHCNDPGDEYPH